MNIEKNKESTKLQSYDFLLRWALYCVVKWFKSSVTASWYSGRLYISLHRQPTNSCIGESSNKVQSVLCVGGETGVCFYTRWPVQYFFYQG